MSIVHKNNRPKHVLVIGGRLELCRRLKALGARLSILNLREKVASMAADELYDRIICVEDFDLNGDALTHAKLVHQHDAIDFVAPINELGEELASAIARDLGLPGHDVQTVRWSRNKDQFRQRMIDCSVDTTPYVSFTEIFGVYDEIELLGFPAVLKPVQGRGSSGVALINCVKDIESAISKYQNSRYANSRMMLERAYYGIELSVDTFSIDGQHRLVVIAQSYVSKDLLPLGSSMPANISEKIRKVIKKKVFAMLEALAVKQGPAHTQLLLDDTGVHIIETQLRLPGGYLCDLFEQLTEIDLRELWARHILQQEITEQLNNLSYPEQHFVASHYTSPKEEGNLIRIMGIDSAKQTAGVFAVFCDVKIDFSVTVAKDSFTRGVCVLAKAGSDKGALDIARNAAENIHFLCDTNTFKPENTKFSNRNNRHQHALLVGVRRDMHKKFLMKSDSVWISTIIDIHTISKLEDRKAYFSIIALPMTTPISEWLGHVKILSNCLNIDCIGPINELLEHHAAYIAEELDLIGPKIDVVNLTRDKFLMRRRLSYCGIDNVKAQRVLDRANILAFIDKYGFPVVIKPCDGRGSQGVFYVDNDRAIEEAIQAAGEDKLKQGLIVEEYIEGQEYSIEAFSIAGVHYFICATEKETQGRHFVELSHSLPAYIPETCFSFVDQVLTDLGVENGPTHSEIVLTKSGPKLIETQLRVAGDYIAELIKEALGIDILELWVRQILGNQINCKDLEPTKHDCYAAIAFSFSYLRGTIKSVSGQVNIHDQDLVLFKMLKEPGDLVDYTVDSFSRLAFAIVKGESQRSALQKAKTLVGKIKINL